jgi:PHD/YefM family antitoxin component YafN of YafNO toxin-antitoxin module
MEGAMPTIRPSADLRNNYNEISEFCHSFTEPVFITKNGQGDLAVMSIETYELLAGKAELHRLLDAGLKADQEGRSRPMDDVLGDFRKKPRL